MMLSDEVVSELTVPPGSAAGLSGRSTSGTRTDWLPSAGGDGRKGATSRVLEQSVRELEAAQEALYASDTWALLVVFQALDAGGKDGTIKHVMSGVNPQGCAVHVFREPSPEELRHDFLWRAAIALPARGQIGIFNRSYYEEVLVVRVHPELLDHEHLPVTGATEGSLWTDRFDDINAFERHLARSGTRVVKFFLHISKDEQRRRLLRRLSDPAKQWKYSPSDLADHERFDDFRLAYEEMLTATSTPWAPWYVVPADDKPAMRALVGGMIVGAIDRLELTPPVLDDARRAELAEGRRALEREGGAGT